MPPRHAAPEPPLFDDARRPATPPIAGSPRERIPALALQPELPFGRQPAHLEGEAVRVALERRLAATLGQGVRVTLTDNRRTMLSVYRADTARHVRLHHMFADAPPEVIESVGRYLARGDRFASRVIDRYIAANQSRIRTTGPSHPARLRPVGAVHDLTEIQRGLSALYFEGRVALDITWGRRATSRPGRRRGRRTIRMGTYFIDEQLIRIHPALDQGFVPRYFVEWVVYHEMLHHVVPMPLVDGRRIYHSDEFHARERLYADYERARAWEKRYLTRLIGSRARTD